jgi:hypothetical protein
MQPRGPVRQPYSYSVSSPHRLFSKHSSTASCECEHYRVLRRKANVNDALFFFISVQSTCKEQYVLAKRHTLFLKLAFFSAENKTKRSENERRLYKIVFDDIFPRTNVLMGAAFLSKKVISMRQA